MSRRLHARAASDRSPRAAKWLIMALATVALTGIYAWRSGDRSIVWTSSAMETGVRGSAPLGRAKNGTERRPPRGAQHTRHAATEERSATAGEAEAAASRTIRGTVSTSDGNVLAAAEVCLSRSRSGLDDPVLCATTDHAGAYQIASGGEGDLLIATARAHESRLRNVPSSGDLDAMDFVLGPVRVANVRGVVVDALGGPVPRALVLSQQGGRTDIVASGWSDEEGRFGLAVEPGAVTLSAQAEAYAPSRVEIEAPAERVTLALAASSTLAGLVVDGVTGRAVPDVLVSAYSLSVIHPVGLQVATDAEGRFRLTGLHAGGYQLRAAGSGWGGGEATATVGVAEVSAPIVLRVRAASTLTGVIRAGGEGCADGAVWIRDDAVSLSGEADASGAISVRGIVAGTYEVTVRCPHAVALQESIEIDAGPVHREWDLDLGIALRASLERANGKAADVRALRMMPVPGPGAENERSRSSVHCVAETGSEFVCRGIEPGHYEFSVGSQAPVTLGSISIGPAGHDPSPIVLRMPPLASILAQVIDGSESAQPSTFEVFARQPAVTPVRAERTAEGDLLRDLPLGSYVIYLGPTSEIPEASPHVVLTKDDELARVTLTLPPMLDISGVVVDASGARIPEIWLRAESPANLIPMKASGVPTLSNERGEFVLQGLIPGAYDIVSSGRAARPLVASVSAGSRGLVLQLLD